MTMEGTWKIAEFQQKMGDKVDVFVPPFSDTPSRASSSTPATASR